MAGTDSRYAYQHPWLKTNNVVGKMGCWLCFRTLRSQLTIYNSSIGSDKFHNKFLVFYYGLGSIGLWSLPRRHFWDLGQVDPVTIHAINEVNDGVIVIWLWLSICWPKSGYFSVYACRCSRVTFVNIDLIYFLFWFFFFDFFLVGYL